MVSYSNCWERWSKLWTVWIVGPWYVLCLTTTWNNALMAHCTICLLLRQAGITHAIAPLYLRLSLEERPESGRGGHPLTVYGWRGDRHNRVHLVGVSRCKRPISSHGYLAGTCLRAHEFLSLPPVLTPGLAEVGRMLLMHWPLSSRQSRTNTPRCVLDTASTSRPFDFSVFYPFGLAAQELLHRMYRRYRIHARLRSGRPMLGSTVASPLQSCTGWLTSLPVVVRFFRLVIWFIMLLLLIVTITLAMMRLPSLSSVTCWIFKCTSIISLHATCACMNVNYLPLTR